MITTMTIRYGALDRSLGKFGRVPDPPDIDFECPEEFDNEYCEICSNYDECRKENNE